MGQLRIRVGAALDADALTVYQPLVNAAKRARQQIDAQFNQAARSMGSGSPYRTAALQSSVAIKASATTAAASVSVIGGKAIDAGHKFDQLAKSAKALGPSLQTVAREAERELKRIEGAAARAQLGIGDRGWRGQFNGRNAIQGGMGYMGTAARAGLGLASGLARGAGVDFGLAGAVGRNVERQDMAVDIVNSGHIFGAQGANGKRQDAGQIQSEALAIGSVAGKDSTEVLRGLAQFTKLTGDLETARGIMGDLAKFSVATGSDLGDMAAAAGSVSTSLGNVPGKAGKIKAIMEAVAAQGKQGAVEMSDFASQMVKITAVAPQFAGDVSENIKKLAAFAQLARGQGGSAGAANAATSVMSFTNTLKTPARIKAFEREGIKLYDAAGKFFDPETIVLESLKRTKGDPKRFKTMWASIIGAKPAEAMANAYRSVSADTDGGDKGKLAAAHKLFADVANASLGDTVEGAFKAKAEDDKSRAQRFQNALDETARGLQSKLLPAIERLGPVVLKSAEAFATMAGWAVDNPFKAAGATLAGSIAKAGIEEAIKATAQNAIKGGLESGLMSLGKAAGIAGVAMGAWAVALDQADKLLHEMNVKTVSNMPDEEARKLAAMTPEQRRSYMNNEMAAGQNKANLDRAGYLTDNKDAAGPIDPRVLALVDPTGKNGGKLDDAALLAALGGELKVRVVNPQDIASGQPALTPTPGVDNTGRRGPHDPRGLL